MVSYDRSPSPPRLILGIAIMGLGVVFLLDRLGFDVGHVWSYWPLVLIAVGLGKLLQSSVGGGRGFGAILVLVGAWLLLENLDLIRYDLFDLWPVILLLVGGSLVWRAFRPQRRCFPPPPPSGLTLSPEGVTGEVATSGNTEGRSLDADATIHAAAVMGGIERRSACPDFQGGDLTALMGGCELDLRQASIRTGPAVVDVFAFWGGIELHVPTNWTLDIRATPIMGAIEDNTGPAARDPGQVLIIRGTVIMGGVEIKN
jgi:predicted membrane protein